MPNLFDGYVLKPIKRHVMESGVYKRISQWTSAQDVEMDDHSTLQSTMDGVKTSLANEVTRATQDVIDEETRASGVEAGLETNKQPKTTSSPVTVNGSVQTTVESILGALNNFVNSIKTAVDTLNGNASVSGSVDNKIATAIANFGGFEVLDDGVTHEDIEEPAHNVMYLEKKSVVVGPDFYQTWIYDLTDNWRLIDDVSIDLTNYIQNTDYATLLKAGLVKPDGNTIIVDADGTIHWQDDTYVGSKAVWDTMTNTQKTPYKHMDFTDDIVNDGMIVDVVETGNSNAVTSNAVALMGNTKANAQDLNTHTADGTVHITSTERTNWNDANNKKHEHSNKTVLDGITSTNITNWNDANSKKHEHTNKTVLDGVSSTKVSNWDTAYANTHTHSNKTVLDGIAASDVSNWNGKANQTDLTALATKVDNRTSKVYGFHISDSESSPSAKVTYIADAVGMTPAYMDYTNDTFNYGSWENIWFVRDCKPCVLKQNGTVQCYLQKNDYTKDIDGNDVTIDENLTDANVMIEFPKIWYKVVPDSDNSNAGSVYIAPIKIDEDYVDYAYIDYKGNHKEHFYMPAYNASNIDNVMRSLSGQSTTKMKSLNSQTEINYAKANGDGWMTEDAGEVMLINFLLILMGKSTDTQTVFGKGLTDSGTEAINNGFVTGVHNQKGLFYGTNSGASATYTNAVKVFGIENWWGFIWRRYVGDINDKGVRKIKLCYSNEDGSSAFDYNTTGVGYVNVGSTPSGSSGGHINKMKFTKTGMYSQVSSGSATTHYCDGQWFNNSQLNFASRGGLSNNGLRCGACYVTLNDAPGVAWWYIAAALSWK